MRCKLLIVPVTLIALVSGCASGPPSAKSLARSGDAAFKKQRYDDALRFYTTAQDLHSGALDSDAKLAQSRENYQDTQIIYGTRKAEEAAAAGDPRQAWLWYSLVVGVAPEDERCLDAATKLEAIEQQMVADCTAEAQAARDRGEPLQAVLMDIRQAWIKNQGVEDVTQARLTALQNGDTAVLAAAPITRPTGPVRPDSADLYDTSLAYNPYGIPVFFGEVPVAYEVVGDLRVKGVPMQSTYGTRQYAKEMDALYHLSNRAMKKGADALVNVSYRRKGRNTITEAEMIKYVE